MRIETLLSPGKLANGINLRNEAAKAISAIEVVAPRMPGGVYAAANVLHAFFTDCASKIAALRDLVVPTVSTRTAPASGATVITLTMSEDMDPGFVPVGTAFVFSPAKTVSSVAVRGTKVIITTTAAVANGDTVAYTQPGTNNLRDLAGNLLANFAASAITVA